jgi:hypothetical protein
MGVPGAKLQAEDKAKNKQTAAFRNVWRFDTMRGIVAIFCLVF